MLSSIGRASIKRVVATTSTSTNRASQTLWQLQRVNGLPDTGINAKNLHSFLSSYRLYATTTKAAVKPSASTKSKTTTPKTAAKKPIKKKAVKQAKAKPKKKPVKKPVKKAKQIKKVKKVLTVEQKLRLELKALKITALSPPKKLSETVLTTVVAELVKGGGITFTQASEKYRALTPAEVEHYNHIANQNKVANQTAYKKWIDTFTPDEIRVANNARILLRRKDPVKKKWTLLADPRLPKRPRNPYANFLTERFSSGDFKGIKLGEAAKLIAAEYKALSPGEKKVHEDFFKSEHQRYLQEYKTVYHRDSPSVAEKA